MNGVTFKQKYDEGKEGELILDRHFSTKYIIVDIPSAMERVGDIDRLFTCCATNQVFTVEYKSDFEAVMNVFIETYCEGRGEANRGWALDCLAQYLAIYIPHWNKVLTVPMSTVKARIPEWLGKYGESPARDKTVGRGKPYQARGIPVPIQEMIKHGKYRDIEPPAPPGRDRLTAQNTPTPNGVGHPEGAKNGQECHQVSADAA